MGSAYTLDGIPPISTDRELLYTQKVHALSLMWQTAGVVLDRLDIKNISADYRERLSQIYNDPFASTEERQQFSAQTNGLIRDEITGVVLDVRQNIGDISGYTPHEQTVSTWSESVFYY